jgi:hypothetical protein
MNITILSGTKPFGTFSSVEELDAALAEHTDLDEITVNLEYDFPLVATVFREPGKQDMVRVDARGREQLFARDGTETPGDLGVSCNPHGSSTPVHTINVPFRPYEDPAVLKGMVWIIPSSGNMYAQMYVNLNLLKGTKMSALIAEAQHEINEKVLRHFAN